MPIAGAGTTVVRALQRGFVRRYGDLRGLSFRTFTTTDFENGLRDTVSLFLYRVEVDRTRRHRRIPPARPGAPEQTALSLELHFLLTVWSNNAVMEHQTLQDCMEILDRNAILAGDSLDPAYTWAPGEALKISLEGLSTEDMMRVWDSLATGYHLSLPYLVRTVRLTPEEVTARPLVETARHEYLPMVPPPEER